MEENGNAFIEASVRIITYSTFHNIRFQEIPIDLSDTFKNDGSAAKEDSEQDSHEMGQVSSSYRMTPLDIICIVAIGTRHSAIFLF